MSLCKWYVTERCDRVEFVAKNDCVKLNNARVYSGLGGRLFFCSYVTVKKNI